MRIWKCTVCGKEDKWDSNWSYYGSIALEESFPSLLIIICSDSCKLIADDNIRSRKWELPVLRMRMEGSTLVREQRGYYAQPDKQTLWEKWKRDHKQPSNVEFIR